MEAPFIVSPEGPVADATALCASEAGPTEKKMADAKKTLQATQSNLDNPNSPRNSTFRVSAARLREGCGSVLLHPQSNWGDKPFRSTSLRSQHRAMHMTFGWPAATIGVSATTQVS